jgi:carboxymethylenebutenolidase
MLWERDFEVPTADGTMATFVAGQSQSHPAPFVIIYMDVWGIREELRQIARDVAAKGYCCALPDLYYRQGTVRHEFRDADGRMITLEKLSDADKERVRAPLRSLTDKMVMQDTENLIRFARERRFASVQRVAVIGYCMGGRHALVAAGTFPDEVGAAACLHGTRLVIDGPDSAHRVAARAKGAIYCGFAEHDRFAAPAIVRAIELEMRAAGVSYCFKVHGNADHGYALPDRDLYDREATRQDWTTIEAMLQRQLSATAHALKSSMDIG